MPKVVKCNSCNIIIDELLSYVQNKLSVIDEDTLVRICSSTFSTEEIEKSKSMLYESVPVDKAKIKRKNTGKEKRDLVDILSVFKTVEPDLFPIFVARDLERLPPVLFDHLDCTKLLKDLLRVQNDVKDLKETYVTQAQLSELRTEMLKIQNESLVPASVCKVNMKRGAWLMDSGPIGLSHGINSSMDGCNSSVEETSLNGQIISEQRLETALKVGGEQPITVTRPQSQQAEDAGGSSASHGAAAAPTGVSRPMTSPARVAASPLLSADRIAYNNNGHTSKTGEESTESRKVTLSVTERETMQSEDDKGWQKVSHRKKPMKYRYLGTTGISRGTEGNFKAAVRKVPILITKVHKDSTERDIAKYIFEKTRENIVLERIDAKYDREYNSYKFFISENQLTVFLDRKLWPEGIIFRRFVNFKTRKMNDTNKSIVHGH